MRTELRGIVLCDIIHSSRVTEGQADCWIPTAAIGGEMGN